MSSPWPYNLPLGFHDNDGADATVHLRITNCCSFECGIIPCCKGFDSTNAKRQIQYRV